MKIVVSFKTPDALEYAIKEHLEAEQVADDDGMPDPENGHDDMFDELKEKLSEWVEYGECVSIEFDTEAGTATVLKVK